MADQEQTAPQGETTPSRRARAPTITINNENGPAQTQSASDATDPNTSSPTSHPDEAHSTPMATDPLSSSWASLQKTSGPGRPDMQPLSSLDTRDSRPTSPHNVSSPVTSRGNDRAQGLLTVPSNLRSRQNSVDSDDASRSFTSSQVDTVVGSSSYPGNKSHRSTATAVEKSSHNNRIMEDPNALKPDQGKEEDFVVERNPFAFSPGQLNKMFDPKSLAAFYKLGGMKGLEKGLRTDKKAGLSIDENHLQGAVSFEDATSADEKKSKEKVEEPADTGMERTRSHGTTHGGKSKAQDDHFSDRKRIYKDNRLPEKKGKSLWQLMWITYNDKVLMLLSIAAVVSLAIGLYQTFGQEHDPDHPPVEWVEGVAIIVAILIVVVVGSLNDYQKERQFAKLNRKKQDRIVKVIRSGKTIEISVHDILVGDVVHIEPGDLIPVDGVLIEGFNVKCDESQATGESDIIKKRGGDEVFTAIENHEELRKMDPFIQSGARVMEGVGTFLVTSTGVYSTYGKTLMSLNEDPEMTPLQSKLNVIAEYIAKLGGAAGLLLFIVLFIEFLVRLPKMTTETPAEKGQVFLNIFIVVVTIIVVAVPEGLPLAVTLALAVATTRMLKDNNLVRHLKACEVMGNATTICSDKTGTLTQNKMQLVAGTVGTSHRFGDVKGNDGSQTPASPESSKSIGPQEFVTMLSPEVKELLLKSIALNSTAFEGEIDGEKTFIGSKTETALLLFAKEFLGMGPVSEERSNAKILQLIPFDSGRKCMGVVTQREGGKARLYVKGASEIMLEKCTRLLRDPSSDLSAATLSEEHRETIKDLIETYASHSLRTIGIIYKDFESWPPADVRRADGEKDEILFEDLCKDMIFIGMVGIKDPLREGVYDAVKDCQRAGVVVRMVTGDNKLTAQAIAHDCGILQQNSIVMEGPEFRNLTKHQQDEIIPRLHVLARSSPEDKRILVKRLKDKGETVAVTGDGTNDAPALKMADIGFSMGIAGTEVAKEASSIILMDDNFNSIVKALKWGRAVNDAVKRFLQFQLTVNVTAVVLTFVSAVSSQTESSVLTAVQLLWVNLIMDTLAALALATDPPQDSVLERKPERKGSSIISVTMWKMILGQAIYQLLITFLIYFGSPGILPEYDPGDQIDASEIQTLVFNTFVWMQIFNQWNNRRLDNRFNIFEGITKNWFFIGINILMMGGQVLIVMVGSHPFNISPKGQTPAMWGYAIVLGALSIPIGMIIRLVPDTFVERLVPSRFKRRGHLNVPGLTVSDDEERFSSYPAAFTEVRDELAFVKRFKGGRVNNLKFAMKHPRETFMPRRSPGHSRDASRSNSVNLRPPPPQTPTREDSYGPAVPGATTPDSASRGKQGRERGKSMRSRSNSAMGAATVMTGIVASSIGAGWSPIDRTTSEAREFGQFPPPTRTPSPLSRDNSDQSARQPDKSQRGIGRSNSNVLGGQSLTAEPQDMSGEEGRISNSSEVPRLALPKPPASPRKSMS